MNIDQTLQQILQTEGWATASEREESIVYAKDCRGSEIAAAWTRRDPVCHRHGRRSHLSAVNPEDEVKLFREAEAAQTD